MQPSLDALDHSLITLLTADPRATNRSLAAQLGVVDETVAARLTRLRASHSLVTTAVVDWEAAGYRSLAIVRLRVDGTPPADVAKPLLDVPEVYGVSQTIGCADLVVFVLGRDISAVRASIAEHLLGQRAAAGVHVDVVTHVHSINRSLATLPLPTWSAGSLPDPVVPLDDVDVRLIDEIVVAGHEPLREIARRLSVSDTTVRSRLRRLEDAGLVRTAVLHDPRTVGDGRAIGHLWLRTDGSDPAQLLASLIDVDEPALVVSCVGSDDVHATVTASNHDELAHLICDVLPAINGIRAIKAAIVVAGLVHRANLSRFTGSNRSR